MSFKEFSIAHKTPTEEKPAVPAKEQPAVTSPGDAPAVAPTEGTPAGKS